MQLFTNIMGTAAKMIILNATPQYGLNQKKIINSCVHSILLKSMQISGK